MANLDIIEREGLTQKAAEVGAYFLQRLRGEFVDRPYVAEVRGVGLLAAIEFAQDPGQRQRFDAERRVGAQLAAACLEEGVIVRSMPHGDILGFAPPLVITRDEVDEVVRRVVRAVEKVTRKI